MKELNEKELSEVEGGFFPSSAYYISKYFNELWHGFIDGFNDGSGANC